MQIPLAIDGQCSFLETPDLQLVLLAERHDALLAF